MVVATVSYGTVNTHTGTLAEVAGVIGALPSSKIISVFYNGTNISAVVKR
jgi:uncharacterized NAD-dependent epimerase/dehydratase family protein